MPPKQMQNLAKKNLVNEITQKFESISTNKLDQNALLTSTNKRSN